MYRKLSKICIKKPKNMKVERLKYKKTQIQRNEKGRKKTTEIKQTKQEIKIREKER